MHAGNYSLGGNFRPLKPLNHRYFFTLSEKLQRTLYKNLKETVGTDSRYGFLVILSLKLTCPQPKLKDFFVI